MKNTHTNLTHLKCNDCGSDLVIVEETTMTLGNNLYPITKTIYRCTNKECQDDSDQKNAKRAEVRHDQEMARQKRLADSKIATAAKL